VIDLVRRLEAMSLSPVVVARGYHAADAAPNDEERLIRKRCPSVGYVANPDRAAAALAAHRTLGADVIVLDDGFQHRRLARDLDIVLVDATHPFGSDHLLPRGLLREPITSLRRADVIVLTRSDQVAPAQLPRLEARLRAANHDALLLQCVHRVDGIVRLDGRPLEATLDGTRVVLFAGIGNPDAFAATVSALGAQVVESCWWSDHHRYTRRDVDRLAATGRFPPHDWLVTTEKDGVKLAALEGLDHLPLAVVCVSIAFRGDAVDSFDDLLLRTAKQGATG
jgi:tetraacyldisaccharide 4'-kinase